jgi:aspartyl-tRNA(Asn)/glutamyl-tRNA(Gln) amidotransferase subunit A
MSWPATVSELSDQLQSKQVSAVEVAEESIRRIDAADDRIGAFLSTADPEKLLEDAARVDQARHRDEHPSPLAGVPIAVKDNIAVEGQPLTCGSRILADYSPPYTSTAVQRLQQAGLLIVGKTNMDEFGFGSSTENSAFKVTANPRDLGRVPGGTSGGSAASVAAGMVPWALGTDTGGSVRQPASLCGVVGMRPSYGRVSRYGLVAYASSMDQIGPFANCVADAAALLEIVMGADPCDSTCLPGRAPDLSSDAPASLKIGVPEEYHSEGCDPSVSAVVDAAVAGIEELGWETKTVSLPLTRYALDAYYLIASVEAASNLGRYDGVRYGHRAADRASWLEMLSATRTEGFGAEAKRRIMLGTFASSSGYYDEYYLNALRVRTLLVDEFVGAFEDVDLLLSPVSPSTAWPIGQRTADPMAMYLSDVFSVPVALAGIPAIVIPAGDDEDGLPVGVQIAGPAGGDALVVGAARRLEQALGYELGRGFSPVG